MSHSMMVNSDFQEPKEEGGNNCDMATLFPSSLLCIHKELVDNSLKGSNNAESHDKDKEEGEDIEKSKFMEKPINWNTCSNGCVTTRKCIEIVGSICMDRKLIPC